LIDIWVNKPYFIKVVLVAESLEHPLMVRSVWGSNPAASLLFFYFCFFLIVGGAPGHGASDADHGQRRFLDVSFPTFVTQIQIKVDCSRKSLSVLREI
jgi:hypothetical protein